MQFNLFTLTNTTWDPWLFNHKCWPSNMNHTDHIFCHCHVHFTLSEYLNKHLEQYSSSTCRLVYISSWKLHILLHVSFFSQLYLWLILRSRRGEGGGRFIDRIQLGWKVRAGLKRFYDEVVQLLSALLPLPCLQTSRSLNKNKTFYML